MIVLAGKNNLVVHLLNYLASCQEINNLVAICNKTDKGIDTWQMLLRKKTINFRVMEIINKCVV